MTLPKFRGIHQLLAALVLLWFLAFLYFERLVPVFSAARCLWPENTHKVLLVADPQLIDNHTYPGRLRAGMALSKHTVDLYLRRNYHAMVAHLQPHYIMFLGDYLDNGRSALDEYYAKEVRRFFSVFASAHTHGETWFTDVPGNHDIGFGDRVKLALRARFAKHFGAPNTVHTVGGVDFVTVDVLLYSAEDPIINSEARDFVAGLGGANKRVLLSHIPFYRDTEVQLCGPLRELKEFAQTAGYQYQLALLPEVSAELLQRVGPALIFSGDDHDYCDVTHSHEGGAAREITVKSISMAMGIWRPAVQLLAFSDGLASYDTHLCLLPTPYANVAAYVALAAASAALLFYWNMKQRLGRYYGEPEAGGVSRKLSNFLRDPELLRATPLPQYTLTQKARHVRAWWRKYNLGSFARHSLLLACFVLAMYRVV